MPKIDIDSAGNFAVTYYGNGKSGLDIFLNSYDSAAVELNSGLIVNDDNTSNSQNYPDISINEKGECIVVWYDYRSNSGIYFQKYNNIGSNDNFEKVDSNIFATGYYMPITYPKVSLNENGEFAISWSEYSNSKYDLKFRVFDSESVPITEVLYGTSNANRNQRFPDLYFSKSKIYNTWQDNSEPGIGYDIWANVFNLEDLVTDIHESIDQLPKEFSLKQNYPNPFNPSTIIEYTVPNVVDAKFASTTLKVYDILGREVKVLVNKYQQPGNYKFEFNGSGLCSGMYFYKLEVENFSEVKKMMLLK